MTIEDVHSLLDEYLPALERLEDIASQLELVNMVLSGVVLFLGIIFGLLLVKVMWDRFRRF